LTNLLVVESPAKAKTINKYLGKDYRVVASYGHIRDLPTKDGSVDVDNDFKMTWDIEPKNEKHIRDIIKGLSGVDTLYLATDPDREGEAISWHIIEELKRRKKLGNIPVKRVVFNEITKSAVKNGIDNPRDIDADLVDAYLARRALDYLVGFNISPVLWKKLPGSKSAGRVQSVALKLICERENEIENFVKEEYWTIEGDFLTAGNEPFKAKLNMLDGKKLEKFSIPNEESAKKAVATINAASFAIAKIENKRVKRSPYPAFTTSTLQQEAARKLYFSAKKTMQIAQQLYEGVDIGGDTMGLITYMRTDGVQMANEAVFAIRDLVKNVYGERFVPEKPRFYKNKTKNAQEAHEAIRPTNFAYPPERVAKYLDKDQLKLYELVWKRALASQMENAEFDKMGVDILSADGKTGFKATGQKIAFEGFMKAYKEDFDDKNAAEDDENRLLPEMKEKEAVKIVKVTPDGHFTEPPPRYSEASLVKKMEELGIGRPSTYASIISVLQDRKYVTLVNRKFVPEDRGMIVTIFLNNYFNTYVKYDYTALLEDKLDEVSEGKLKWRDLLHHFWVDFSKNLHDVDPLTKVEVSEKIDQEMGKYLFKTEEDRKCPDCGNGRLSVKLGRYGAFVGCSNYPNCKYTKQFNADDGIEDGSVEEFEKRDMSQVFANGIALKKGPYGYYVEKEIDGKLKRTGLTRKMNPEDITAEVAEKLIALPRNLGKDDDGEVISVGIGRFGPFIKKKATFKSIPVSDDVLTITLERAKELLKTVKPKTEPVVIGKHPKNKKEITLNVGRFGPYLKNGKLMVSLPKSFIKEKRNPTLEEAIEILGKKGK